MAVWGIGAYYKGSEKADKTDDFLLKEKAYLGWSETEAPALHRMFDSIKAGDIIYIKSFALSTRKMIIKAVGLVTDTKKELDSLGIGICVKWKEDFSEITVEVSEDIYRNNVFNNTLYEEYNPKIIKEIIKSIL